MKIEVINLSLRAEDFMDKEGFELIHSSMVSTVFEPPGFASVNPVIKVGDEADYPYVSITYAGAASKVLNILRKEGLLTEQPARIMRDTDKKVPLLRLLQIIPREENNIELLFRDVHCG